MSEELSRNCAIGHLSDADVNEACITLKRFNKPTLDRFYVLNAPEVA